MPLQNKTIFITGGSRGIGRAIALKCAKAGANIVIAAKSSDPHPTLKGTIHSVAAEVEAHGGKALALQLDVRDEAAVNAAIETAAQHFGGIDGLINNASALKLKPTARTAAKDYDLMQSINARGVFLSVKACMPYLTKAENAHVITMSPPLNLNPKWLGACPTYMLSKYGMTLLTLGFAEEYKDDNVRCNTLWPQTLIATDAVKVNFLSVYDFCMKPAIVADAAFELLTQENAPTGQSLIDQDILTAAGHTDFKAYRVDPDTEPHIDMFLD
jgi:citronellol/citronellal dehydrogenase